MIYIERKKSLQWKLSVLVILSIASLTESAFSKPQDVSDGELALLPEYCPDTMGFKYGDAYFNTSPRAAYWISLMGPGFWNLHHYCWGLVNLRRSNLPGTSAQQKNLLLAEVISDYLYVVKKNGADFILLPEILTRAGDAELLRENSPSANQYYQQARKIKPDYWPAYANWSEFLIRMKLFKQAKELIEEGLLKAPTSKRLIDQYRRLGGDPAKITKNPDSSNELAPNQPAAAQLMSPASHASSSSSGLE